MPTYQKVSSSDSSDGEEGERQVHAPYRNRHCNSGPCHWIVWLLLLVITNVVTFLWATRWSWTERDHLNAITQWSPLHSSLPYHLHTETLDTMSNTDSPSPWRQEPSLEVDKLWEDHWDSNPMLMPVKDVVKIGHDPDYVVRWPSPDGTETTIVSNHAHHLLHCLDELRKSVWASHYWPDGNLNPFHRNHQAHCVDLLRQDLMCRAPRNVVSWIWMESEPAPQPNFNVSMKCANDGWDDMWSWWEERQLTKKQLDTEEPAKPVGVKEWPTSSAQKKENEALKELCSQPGVKCTQAGEPVDFSGH